MDQIPTTTHRVRPSLMPRLLNCFSVQRSEVPFSFWPHDSPSGKGVHGVVVAYKIYYSCLAIMISFFFSFFLSGHAIYWWNRCFPFFFTNILVCCVLASVYNRYFHLLMLICFVYYTVLLIVLHMNFHLFLKNFIYRFLSASSYWKYVLTISSGFCW